MALKSALAPRRTSLLVGPFAVIDREGDESVLMVVDERAYAEAIAVDSRATGIRAVVIDDS